MMIIINYRNILSKLENHIVDKLEIDKNLSQCFYQKAIKIKVLQQLPCT